jgi:hypothetical protein
MNNDEWEFYSALDGNGKLMCWAWRRNGEGTMIQHSGQFLTFIDCFQNAVSAGFCGKLQFATDARRPQREFVQAADDAGVGRTREKPSGRI